MEPIPRLEVVSEQYFRELKPYYDKVHNRQPLDASEIGKIVEMKGKLEEMYQPEALQDSQIMTHIHHITGRNTTVTMEREEEELGREYDDLGVKLRTDNSLMPVQKEQIEDRRQKIRGTLYPEYHPPAP